jgi:RHS repeat-associated protein
MMDFSIFIVFVKPNVVARSCFTGQRLDSQAGLLYYGFRYYDLLSRRFTRADTQGYSIDKSWCSYYTMECNESER